MTLFTSAAYKELKNLDNIKKFIGGRRNIIGFLLIIEQRSKKEFCLFNP